MAGLKTYQVEVNGTTAWLRLSDADALARGLLKPAAAPESKEAAAPLNKSRAGATKTK